MAQTRFKAIVDRPAPMHLDIGVPHIARVYDYCLGRKIQVVQTP